MSTLAYMGKPVHIVNFDGRMVLVRNTDGWTKPVHASLVKIVPCECERDGGECDLRETDCCDMPRPTCETGWALDGAGDPDVCCCTHGHGCDS